MTLDQFHNGLRVLTSIDRHELEAVGIIDVPKGQGVYPGCMDEPNEMWRRFQSDPFRFFIRCDDDRAQKIWSIIEKRSLTNSLKKIPVLGKLNVDNPSDPMNRRTLP